MLLPHIKFGKVYSYLIERLDSINSALERDESDAIRSSILELTESPLYINLPDFQLPVSRGGAKFHELSNALDRLKGNIEHYKKYDFRNALVNIHHTLVAFQDSYSPVVNEKSYFIVPVIINDDQTKQKSGGLVYLRADKIVEKDTNSKLFIHGLTDDEKLFKTQYFERLAECLEKSLYYVTRMPFIANRALLGYKYRLLFGCEIAMGKSMSAALLALYAVIYFRDKLGITNPITPQNGTVITGVVDVTTGKITTVEGLQEKIHCAVDEYGPNLKVIIPKGEQLRPDILEKIDAGNLHVVSTVEELLVAVLASKKNPNALMRARHELYRGLSLAEKEQLQEHLVEGVRGDIYDVQNGELNSKLAARKYQEGIYALAKKWQNHLEIRLGFEKTVVENSEEERESTRQKVIVILDGSAAMEKHWQKNGTVCNMTDVLFKINEKVDNERQELWYGFLSHDEFYPLTNTTSAGIEQAITKTRAQHNCQQVPAFFRPVLEGLIQKLSDESKEIYIISDSFIPDLEDFKEQHTSISHRFNLSSGTDDYSKLLYTDDEEHLKDAILDTYFQETFGRITSFDINFGKELPIRWVGTNGAIGNLEKDSVSQDFILKWSNINDLQFNFKVEMAYDLPGKVSITGLADRMERHAPFNFSLKPHSSQVTSLDTVQGRLSPEEHSRWQEMCTSNRHAGLLKDELISTVPADEFPSLQALGTGFLVMVENEASWYHFQMGCQLRGISIFKLNGKLYYSSSKGTEKEVEPYSSQNNIYTIKEGAKQIFIGKILKPNSENLWQ